MTSRSLATLLQQYIIVDSMSFVQIPALTGTGSYCVEQTLQASNMTVAAIVNIFSAKV